MPRRLLHDRSARSQRGDPDRLAHPARADRLDRGPPDPADPRDAERASQGGRLTMLQKYPLHAYIPAKDLERARRFYEDKVGLKPKAVTLGGVYYEFGGGTACFLYPSAGAGTSKASQAFWDVDDVERAVRELEKRGVRFEDYD